jgi:SET domain-containing protein
MMVEPTLEIRSSGSKGLGVFAGEPIAAGQRVLVMGGRILSTAQLSDEWLAMQIGPDQWLCSDGSLIDDRVNHSCDPNTGFRDGDPVLYALRDIAAGEEICWDYSTSIAESGWMLDCACGSPHCRDVVRSWYELTPAQRDRLRVIALGYLRRS